MASTVKVPINLYIFTQIAEGKIDPNTSIEYTATDFETGTGSIQYESYGKEYTIKELQRLSIEQSDNVAINMLLRYVGIDKVHSFENQ
ncbi:MAG TPA: serine hydrolase [Clostridiaceae bacterium]